MSRRSAISGPGGNGGLSLLSRSPSLPSSSMTLAPRLSISSAKARLENADEAASAAAIAIRRMLLLRRRRRLRHAVLVGDERLAEVDRRTILRVGGDRIALLEAYDLELELLALGRGERAARLRRELVPLQVGEHAVAVALVDHLHRQRVVARRDRAVEDFDLLLVAELAALVGLRIDLLPVEGVDVADGRVHRAHLVAMRDHRARAG